MMTLGFPVSLSRRFAAFFLAILLALPLAGCSTVQETSTGRKQLTLFSDGDLNAAALEQYEEVKRTEPLVKSGRQYDSLQVVGGRIAQAANKLDYSWEFILIDTPVVNAWCMPGGKVAVYTGILPIAEDEAGLAAIIGHEVGHALARHANERMTQGTIANVLGSLLGAALDKNKNRDTWMTVFGIGTTVGVLLPYSRKHESEADEIGITLMAKAGYNPSAAPALWDRMAKEGKSGMPTFLSTHPDPAGRAARLRELLPAAMKEYEAAPVRHASNKL